MTDHEITSTNNLLADYSIAPTAAATPRTPAAVDRVLQEAQNVMALTHVDTPLKGNIQNLMYQNYGYKKIEFKEFLIFLGVLNYSKHAKKGY